MYQKTLIMFCAILFTNTSYAVPIVHTADFINDSERSQFNSFENIPNGGTFYTGGANPYIESQIQVQQVNGDSGNAIWVTYDPTGRNGSYVWYPNGGDTGYTSIKLSTGSDFDDVGFLIGGGRSGNFVYTAYFELWNDGSLVLAGSVPHQVPFHYLGFEGGGFDTIFLRDGVAGESFHDRVLNALVIDAIETRTSQVPEPASIAVPEPASIALIGLGLAGICLSRRKFKV